LIELHPVAGLPEIAPGDDLAALIAERCQLADDDILVVAQKVVSKMEGRLRDMREITPGAQALDLAKRNGSDPRQVQAVLDEILRNKPAAAKGRYIKSIATSSTMGPGIRIDPAVVEAARTTAA